MKRLYGILGVLVLLAAGGCDSSGLVPAGGTLTMGKVPVADANVVFMYDNGESAVGVTDKQGKFSLSFNGQPGTRPGKQIGVSVIKLDSSKQPQTVKLPSGPPTGTGIDNPTPTGIYKPEDAPKNLLPAEYGDAKNPKLRLDVPSGGSDKLDIVLP